MAAPQSALELVEYLHRKFAALGQPAAGNSAGTRFLQIVRRRLRHHPEKERLLEKYLCPADARIKSFLDSCLDELVGTIGADPFHRQTPVS